MTGVDIRAQKEKLIRLNKTRTDFQEKVEELIENCNSGTLAHSLPQVYSRSLWSCMLWLLLLTVVLLVFSLVTIPRLPFYSK